MFLNYPLIYTQFIKSLTLDSMVISKIKDGSTIDVGEVDHHSRLYSFSHFVARPDSSLLLMHANEESRIWNKKRGSPLHALEE